MSARIISEEFHDFDQFRDLLLGWDVDVTQLSSGPLCLSSDQVVFDNTLTLTHLKSNRRLADKMAIDHGWVTFVVCFTPNSFCGLEVPSSSMIIFGPGREYRSVLPEGFQSFEICASIDYLSQYGITIGDWKFDELAPERCVLSLTDHYLDQFRQLSLALRSFSKGPSVESLWTTAASERAIGLVLGVLQESGHAKSSPMKRGLSRWTLTTRALDRIDGWGSHYETVAALSKSIGCSSRALQLAFHTSLGMTPLQYILARRLQLARRALLQAAPDQETVTHIATDHEFFHFGRFSQYYKNLFGELPSDSLSKSRKLKSYRR